MQSSVQNLDKGHYNVNLKFDDEDDSFQDNDGKFLSLVAQQLRTNSSLMVKRVTSTFSLASLSTDQWSNFMRKKSRWMANATFEDDSIYDYKSVSLFGMQMLTKQILAVQQERSYYLRKVLAVDIWNHKHLFRHELDKIIMQSINQVDSYDSLVETVLNQI